MGLFHPFYNDKRVEFIGVEAAGLGLKTGHHAAALKKGKLGVLHGSKSFLLEDKDGQIKIAHSISAGLDYPGVGPEHAYYQETGRAQYVTVDDKQALEGVKILSETEGIIPALETAHAVYFVARSAGKIGGKGIIVLCLSGRGDKDIDIMKEHI